MNTLIPNIYDYTDYRNFLSDCYWQGKNSNSGNSLGKIAAKVGYSKVSIKYIIDGKRHVSDEKIMDLADAFFLSDIEKLYFSDLVHFNKTKDTTSKNIFFKRLIEQKCRQTDEEWLKRDQIGIFTDWHYTALLEMLGFDNYQPDISWIKDQLEFHVSSKDIVEALQYLQNRKLEEPVAPEIAKRKKLDRNFASQIYKNFYQRQLKIAQEALDHQSVDDREYFSITLGVNDDIFQALKERINSFRHEVHNSVDIGSPCDRVLQVNLQAFTLAKKK